MKKKLMVAFALLAVVLAAVVFREQTLRTEKFSPTDETLILDDGTKLELWQGDMGAMAYYLPGGIRLLEVRDAEGSRGPENMHTANVDFTLGDLPQAAQAAILDYYETLGTTGRVLTVKPEHWWRPATGIKPEGAASVQICRKIPYQTLYNRDFL